MGHYVLDDGTHVYATCGLAPTPRKDPYNTPCGMLGLSFT